MTIQELINAFSLLHLQYPHVVKFHRQTKQPGKHPQYLSTEMFTNLNMSAIITPEHNIVLLSPNPPGSLFAEYCQTNASKHQQRSIKFGYTINPATQDVRVLVIKTMKTGIKDQDPFANETFFNVRTGLFFSKTQRKYTAKPQLAGELVNPISKHYLFTDYINGRDGYYYLMKFYGSGTLNPPDHMQNALAFMLEVICCHAKGIVHMDIKPENYILKADGDITLVDFGSSYLFNEELKPADDQFKCTARYADRPILDALSSRKPLNITIQLDDYAAGLVVLQILIPKPLTIDNVYYFTPDLEQTGAAKEKFSEINKMIGAHFSEGIKKIYEPNYGSDIGNIVGNLSFPEPEHRTNFLNAFYYLASKNLNIAEHVIKSKIMHAYCKLNNRFLEHPHLRHIIDLSPLLSFLNLRPNEIKWQIMSEENLASHINFLCKLEVTHMYLQLGDSPEVQNAITNIWQQPDKPIFALDTQYYRDEQLEQQFATLYPRPRC